MVAARPKTLLSNFCLTWVLLSLYWKDISALTNVALNKATSQSSHYYNSRRAVDGDANPSYYGWTCTHTSSWWQHKPWWRVDLGKTHVIFKVSLRNRGDCCSERLANFDVKVGNQEYWPSDLCYHRDEPVASGAWLTGKCSKPLSGRYVRIQILGPRPPSDTQILTLCEVQVWGEEIKSYEVEEGSTLTVPCASADGRDYETRAWYRGIQTPSTHVPDPDMVLYSQTSASVPVMPHLEPDAKPDTKIDKSSFNLTFSSVTLEEGALTCYITTGNVTLTEYHQLNVYIQPVIKMTGLETTDFRFFDRVTVTCSIDRLFPAIPLDRYWWGKGFYLMWGWDRIGATETANEDLSYNYTVTKSRVVAAGDDGSTIQCRVKPMFGDTVAVQKKITVHNRNPEVEAVLGLTVFLLLCVVFLVFAQCSHKIIPIFRDDHHLKGSTSIGFGAKKREKKLTFDINTLSAEMYDDGL